MSARVLLPVLVVAFVLAMAAHVSGGVPCTRVDNNTLMVQVGGWSSPDVPLGDPWMESYFDTIMAVGYHMSSAADPWGGDGFASEITDGQVSVLTTPGYTSAAPQIEALGQFNLCAFVSDRQSSPCARGDLFAGPVQGGPVFAATQPVTTLDGSIYLLATGGNVVSGDGEAYIFQGSFVACDDSWLATRGGPDWEVNGVVGGATISEVHLGGINQLYQWQDTDFNPQAIGIYANVAGPWAGGGTGVASSQVYTFGQGSAGSLWGFVAEVWFEVY